MSYKIGQVRKNNSVKYLTDLDWVATSVKTAGYSKVFTDYAIELNGADQNFNSDYTYYVRFTVKRIHFEGDPRFSESSFGGNGADAGADDPRRMNIRLELLKNDGSNTGGTYENGTYQVIEDAVVIDPYIEGYNNEYASFEVIFTPNDSYQYLSFILSRNRFDYLAEAPRNDVAESIDFGENGDVCIINNILPQKRADKIGIQSHPGMMACVNKEAVRVGRSGVYEIHNGVPITFVGFVAPNGSDSTLIDNFILDYSWTD